MFNEFLIFIFFYSLDEMLAAGAPQFDIKVEWSETLKVEFYLPDKNTDIILGVSIG